MSLENLCKNLQGHIVNVRIKSAETKEGIIYMGVLHAFTLQKSPSPGVNVVLKQAKKVNDPLMIPLEKLDVTSKELLEITYLYKEGVHEGGNVKTNAEDIKENRDLVSWEAEHGADAELGELENEKGGDWDQFAVNEKKFGVKSSYTDDNSSIYTVSLNKDSKDYKEKFQKADKVAKEIESAVSNNVHVIEERTGILASDQTEEERYSSVPRTEEAKKGGYVPPHLRGKQEPANPTDQKSPAKTSPNAKPEAKPTTPVATENKPQTKSEPTTVATTTTTTPSTTTTSATTTGTATTTVTPTTKVNETATGKKSVDVSALHLARTTPQVPGKVASEFQHFEQAESGKNKQPKLDVISDFKKFSESTQTKLEKKKTVKQAANATTTTPKKPSPTSTPTTPNAQDNSNPEDQKSPSRTNEVKPLNPNATEFRPGAAFRAPIGIDLQNFSPIRPVYPINMYDPTPYNAYQQPPVYMAGMNPVYQAPYAIPTPVVYTNPYTAQLSQPKSPQQSPQHHQSPQQHASPQHPSQSPQHPSPQLNVNGRVFVPGQSLQQPNFSKK